MPFFRPVAVATTAAVLLLVGGCGGATDESPPSEDPDASTAEQSEGGEIDQDEPDETSADLDAMVDAAVEDVVQQRGIDEAEVEVVRAEEVEWPDGSLGCPEEGEAATQALVPGYLVVLEVEGEQRYYHAAEGDEAPFHCEDPETPAEE